MLEKTLRSIKFWKYFGCYMSFPFLILLIYVAFKSNPSVLSFNANAPHFWTFFTSSFFHNGWSHLFGNVAAYVVLIFLLCLIFSTYDRPEKLNKFFILLILAQPLVTTFGNYIVLYKWYHLPISNMSGSSDIVSGLIGFLFLAFLVLLQCNKFGIFAVVLYLALMGTTIKYQLTNDLSLIVVLLPFLILCLVKFYQKKLDKNNFIFALCVIIVVVSTTVAIFPQKIVIDGVFTNIFSHYLGWIWGLFLGWQITKGMEIKKFDV